MYVSNPSGECADGLGCSGLGALTMDGTGLLGTGLFAGGLDLSTWGAGEMIVAGFGLFVLYSVFSTTSRAARTVGRGASRVQRGVRDIARLPEKRRKARAEKLRDEARRLEGGSFTPRARR